MEKLFFVSLSNLFTVSQISKPNDQCSTQTLLVATHQRDLKSSSCHANIVWISELQNASDVLIYFFKSVLDWCRWFVFQALEFGLNMHAANINVAIVK